MFPPWNVISLFTCICAGICVRVHVYSIHICFGVSICICVNIFICMPLYHTFVYIYASKHAIVGHSTSSSMLESAFQVFRILTEGARTNLYGFGCPLYCHQPHLSTYLLIFILGILSGLALAATLIWTFWTWISCGPAPFSTASPSPSPPVNLRRSALAEYLHEPRSARRR